MTIAIVIAAKGQIHIVSDSQTSNEETFSKNTQKVFFSQKHNIGVCISGHATLKFAGISDISDVIYVDYVFKQFFNYIDEQESFSVTDFDAELNAFVIEKYPQYWDWLKERVSYFYGGFVQASGEVKSVMGCHDPKRSDDDQQLLNIIEEQWVFSEEDAADCYFSNTNAVEKKIAWTLSLPGSPEGMTPKKFLLEAGPREHFLSFTVPHACVNLNKENPFGIGEYLHHVTLWPGKFAERVLRYREAPESALGVACTLNPQDTPHYKVFRSLKESDDAFLKGDLIRYRMSDGQKIDVSSNVEQLVPQEPDHKLAPTSSPR